MYTHPIRRQCVIVQLSPRMHSSFSCSSSADFAYMQIVPRRMTGCCFFEDKETVASVYVILRTSIFEQDERTLVCRMQSSEQRPPRSTQRRRSTRGIFADTLTLENWLHVNEYRSDFLSSSVEVEKMTVRRGVKSSMHKFNRNQSIMPSTDARKNSDRMANDGAGDRDVTSILKQSKSFDGRSLVEFLLVD